MIRSTLKKILGRLLGKKTPPPAQRPAPARQPPPRPSPAPVDHGHDHGHSHDHGHDHGHSHGGEPEAPKPTPKPAPKPAPAPSHDHGHDHGHSHDHGHDHDHGGAAEEPSTPAKAAKKAIEVVVEDTPNPNARKFTASVKVVEKGSLSFNSAEEAENHPLGKALWALGGVSGVFAVKDFVTVTKDDATDWGKLSPKIVKAMKKAL